MIIYIRHGKDENSGYKHDERLTREGKEEVKDFVEKMVKKYGFPHIIYYSPFYRTRQTTKYMLKKINEMNRDIKIKIQLEPKLGRFFTSKERSNPDVHPSTLEKEAIIDKSSKYFKKRVKKQLYSCKKKSEEGKIIWNITHSLVILRVAKYENIERNPHVEYLDYTIIKNDNSSIFSNSFGKI